MDRGLYQTLLLFGATVLVVWGFLLVLSPFLVPIAWALCLAAVTSRPYAALVDRTGRPRLSALLMVVATILVIVVPLAIVLLFAARELSDLGAGGIAQWVADVKTGLPRAYEWIDAQLRYLGLSEGVTGVAKRAAEAAPSLLWRPLAAGAWSVAGGIVTTAVGLVIMFATLYFTYSESPRLHAFVRDLSPLSAKDTDRLLATLQNNTSAAVLGGIVVALIQGALGGVGFCIAGVTAPVLWALVMAFFSLFPIGGAAIVWAPVALYQFAVGATGSGVFLVIWGAVVVGLSDNFLRPWILRRAGSAVHPMLLFFAILSGIGLFGMSGVVFGPLLIALLLTSAEIYREHAKRAAS